MERDRLLNPGLGERRIVFQVDDVDYDLVVPTDMSALRIIRDIARHPRPDWQCEMSSCGRCESLVDGSPVRLCSIGPKRLAGAAVFTREPTRTAAEGRR